MFRQHFGMKINPFDKEIETDNLFETADLKELNSRLKYVMNNRGICLITGEPGSGKSTAIRKFSQGLSSSLFKVCYLSLTTLTVADFYKALVYLLGEEPEYRKIDRYRQIQRSIENFYNEQRITPVIIIDEAHMASTAVLDDIRMIFSFKMDSTNPYVLILTGQPSIRNKLALNMCYPLKQRISMKYSMQGLTAYETDSYIRSRLKLAGADENIFTKPATQAVHDTSNGFLRSINNIATHSLMYSASKNTSTVDEEAVYQANTELAV